MRALSMSIALVLMLSACTTARRAQYGAYGGSQHVALYGCDGKVIQEWDSDGAVHTEEHSDGWFFADRKTGKLVRISGNVVITQN